MKRQDALVTLADCRSLGFCASGLREWFRHRGLSWQDFIERGIKVSEIEAANQPGGPALRVIEAAVARCGRERADAEVQELGDG